jgi:hypothetical protein
VLDWEDDAEFVVNREYVGCELCVTVLSDDEEDERYADTVILVDTVFVWDTIEEAVTLADGECDI